MDTEKKICADWFAHSFSMFPFSRHREIICCTLLPRIFVQVLRFLSVPQRVKKTLRKNEQHEQPFANLLFCSLVMSC